MIEQSLILALSSPDNVENSASRLRQEYLAYQRLFQAQPGLVQQYLSIQAASVADAIDQGASHASFTLPDAVNCEQAGAGRLEPVNIPADRREQLVGGRMDRLTRTDLCTSLCVRLTELEKSANRAVSTGASLFRHALATHMVYNVLPAGRSVAYKTTPNNDIPNQPVEQEFDLESAIASGVDFQTLAGDGEIGRGDLTVPYVEAARRFYLPQWVVFDEHGKLLLNTAREAEAVIRSMQHFLAILQSAVTIAPYMIADDIWQQKRYGMLGQLVNQGRAFAYFQAQEMIHTIKHRASTNQLNRGLRLSLPYFNDQTFQMEECHFEVIPAGRVMFIPAFVVLAVRVQGTKVAQDTSLSQSTRRHLLFILSMFERSFLR